jgi:hypothetical protein
MPLAVELLIGVDEIDDGDEAAAVATAPAAPTEPAEKLETLAKPPKHILATKASSEQLGTNNSPCSTSGTMQMRPTTGQSELIVGMNSCAAGFSDDGSFSLSALPLPKAEALVMLPRGLLEKLLLLPLSQAPTVVATSDLEFVM